MEQRLPDGVQEKARLIERYLGREISGEEQAVLETWLNESPEHRAFFDSVTDKANLQQLLKEFYAAKAMTAEAKASAVELIFGSAAPVRFIPSRWKQWTAAAAILLLAATGAYLWLNQQASSPVAVAEKKEQPAGNDVAPGQYKAKLTLADGSTVVLDSAGTGALAQQGNMQVLNKEGGLVYEGSKGTSNEKMLYNTLTTAKGEMYSLLLSDGTRLWLNSGSSIRYPVVFSGTERTVEITGEVYFEVAKNEKQPFAVTARGQTVKVLGTHFNINAYSDEATIRTTLLEGSVAVTPPGSTKPVLLKPGQQAAVTQAAVDVIANADTEAAVAWKNGYFQFSEADLKTVMRQLERWYDVEIVYEGKVPQPVFSGKLSRNAQASQVLKVLEQNRVHFRIEGKKIIVTP